MSTYSNLYSNYLTFQEKNYEHIPPFSLIDDRKEEGIWEKNSILSGSNPSDIIDNSDSIINSNNIGNSESIINSNNIDNSESIINSNNICSSNNLINSNNICSSNNLINSNNIDNSDNDHDYYRYDGSDNIPPQLPHTQKNENEPNCININNSNSNNPEENLNFNQPRILIPTNGETPCNQAIMDARSRNQKKPRKKKKKTLPQKSKKDRQDNKVIKIKGYIFRKYHAIINKLIKKKYKTKSLCQLNPKIYSEKIYRNKILILFDMSMKEVYTSAEVSTKYKYKTKKDNKKVIEKVYEDPIIKRALDLTFRDLLQIFIKNVDPNSDLFAKTKDLDILYSEIDLLDFLTEVRHKFEDKKKSQQEIEEYIDGSDKETSIIDLCIHMEEWFRDKDPRAERENKSQNKEKKKPKEEKKPKKEEKKPKREVKKPKRGIKK